MFQKLRVSLADVPVCTIQETIFQEEDWAGPITDHMAELYAL